MVFLQPKNAHIGEYRPLNFKIAQTLRSYFGQKEEEKHQQENSHDSKKIMLGKAIERTKPYIELGGIPVFRYYHDIYNGRLSYHSLFYTSRYIDQLGLSKKIRYIVNRWYKNSWLFYGSLKVSDTW